MPWAPMGAGFLTGAFTSRADFKEGDIRGQRHDKMSEANFDKVAPPPAHPYTAAGAAGFDCHQRLSRLCHWTVRAVSRASEAVRMFGRRRITCCQQWVRLPSSSIFCRPL